MMQVEVLMRHRVDDTYKKESLKALFLLQKKESVRSLTQIVKRRNFYNLKLEMISFMMKSNQSISLFSPRKRT